WCMRAAICCSAGSARRWDSGAERCCNGWCHFFWGDTSFRKNKPPPFAFFFFENWLYTATYMADARAMILPLVTTGDPDNVEHDWNAIFSSLGVLQYDTTIAGIVRFVGWCGMVGVVAWLIWRNWSSESKEATALSAEGMRFSEFLGNQSKAE